MNPIENALERDCQWSGTNTSIADYRYYAIVNTVEMVILNESNREFFRKDCQWSGINMGYENIANYFTIEIYC